MCVLRAGVPDSLLKDFCAYVSDTAPASNHIMTANEGRCALHTHLSLHVCWTHFRPSLCICCVRSSSGAAIGVATGYHLATRRFPIVYMQNSGFGNAVNPLLSLADPKVYSIPMLLLIGSVVLRLALPRFGFVFASVCPFVFALRFLTLTHICLCLVPCADGVESRARKTSRSTWCRASA
jgi:hypothetical protein